MKLKLLLITALFACTSTPRVPEPAWFAANVVRISEEYANINTDLTLPQLAAHGIAPGSQFNIRFGERQMIAFLGKDYSDVPKGDWVALIEENGKLQIAISFGHAATEISCKQGDVLQLQARSQPDATK